MGLRHYKGPHERPPLPSDPARERIDPSPTVGSSVEREAGRLTSPRPPLSGPLVAVLLFEAFIDSDPERLLLKGGL